MDLKFLAQCSGVSVQSILEYQQVNRTHILRIDPNSQPALLRSLEARASGRTERADGDIFVADITADGVFREFPVKFIEAELTDKFEDEVGPEIVWKLGGETYPPDSLFGIAGERIDFNVFESHSGKTFDLSVPNENWSRPWVAHGLALVIRDTNEFFWVWTEPVSGMLEVLLDPPVDNTMVLTGVFANVHFDVPNLHMMFPQAPDRPFVIDISNGHYHITGSW